MDWKNIGEILVIAFIVVMGILSILFGLKKDPSHLPNTKTKQDGTNNKPEC